MAISSLLIIDTRLSLSSIHPIHTAPTFFNSALWRGQGSAFPLFAAPWLSPQK